MVPPISQLCYKKLVLYLDGGPNLSIYNMIIFGAKYLPILKQPQNSINSSVKSLFIGYLQIQDNL